MKKNILKIFTILISLLVVPIMIYAEGTITGIMSPVDYGVRAIGMGGAFASISGDATSILWNPAGIAFSENRFFAGSYADLYGLGKIRSGYLSYVQEGGTVTGGIYWTINSVTGLHESETEDSDAWHENTIAYSAAYRITDNMAIGASLKGFFLKTDMNHADGRDIGGGGGGLDLAYIAKFSLDPQNSIGVGLNAENVYGFFSWQEDSKNERIPVRFDIAGHYTYMNFLTASLALKGGEEDVLQKINFGVESWFLGKIIGVRAGFSKYMSGDERTAIHGGLTVEYKNLGIEYAAIIDSDAIGDTHNIGLFFRLP